MALIDFVGLLPIVAQSTPSSGASGTTTTTLAPTTTTTTPTPAATATPIKHIVMIQQENRSFDSYFGTFPGATGFPMVNGVPTVACNPDPIAKTCVQPYVNHANVNRGGPHGTSNEVADISGGTLTGFQAQAATSKNCKLFPDPTCSVPGSANDVMGYHTQSDIPNYWTYAKDFVLQDHFFEASTSWSLPAHFYDVSGWSASCTSPNPMSCTSSVDPALPPANKLPNNVSWTDITYLLSKASVSWGYYVATGTQPDCDVDTAVTCSDKKTQSKATPSVWNPLPAFKDVKQDKQLGNIQDTSAFVLAATTGTLPAVSWVIPNGTESEHPPSTITNGQSYVTTLVNAIMNGPDWNSTAIVISWDDWGGFYDNVVPPTIDNQGYGLRVPGIVISPYAKAGVVDHQVLSTDAYLKFIEDNWLGGQRINASDGRPDSRTVIRENVAQLGDLKNDFDFNQQPRPPVILSSNPKTTLR